MTAARTLTSFPTGHAHTVLIAEIHDLTSILARNGGTLHHTTCTTIAELIEKAAEELGTRLDDYADLLRFAESRRDA